MRNQEVGRIGELEALIWLKGSGYEILETNWRAGKSEVDVVAKQGDCIVFIEVKTRTNTAYEFPEVAVNGAKQKALIRAANQWVMDNPTHTSLRFDIIAIEILHHVKKITHFKDAFFPM